MNTPCCATDWHTLGGLVEELYRAFNTRFDPDLASVCVAIVIHYCFVPDEWES